MKIKLSIIIIILIFAIIGIVTVYSLLTYPNFDKYEHKIEKLAKDEETSYPENYLTKCSFETKKNITFPRVKPTYAELHTDKAFKYGKRLTEKQMNKLIRILNDTSTYTWGELGTAYFDRFITFHDKNDNCIGLTKIDFGGQTYSTPYTAKMKWGLIAPNTNEFFKTIEEIEKTPNP